VAKTELLYRELTYAVIGAAMEVHKLLGSGFLEAVYQSALAHELNLRRIVHEEQVPLKIRYKGIVAGDYRPDFLVDGKVVVEIKATKGLTEIDEAQLINYLNGTGFRLGLLINFGAPSLQYRRRIV